jgi:membrane protease YdiL (CAAX protease family)
LLLLLGYVLSRRGMRIRDLGLRWSPRDIAAGLLVFIISALVYYFGRAFVGMIQHVYFPSAPGGHAPRELFGHPSWQVIPLILINPFFEELTVRAFLMSEVKALTGSWTLAAAASIAVQTSYHLYYGWAGALGLSFQFLVFAVYYAWRRRALPIIVAHGLFDIWAIVPLL